MHTIHKDKGWIKKKVEETDAALLDTDADSISDVGARIIAERLSKNPMRYRDYGAYWWAVKLVLRKHGFDYGQEYDPMAIEYSGDNDDETLVVADEFRSQYLAHYVIGNNEHILSDDDGIMVKIVDRDMENL